MNFNPLHESAAIDGGETAAVVGDATAGIAGVAECPLRDDYPPPLVRIREEHNISRRDIDADALKVLYRLARNNYTAFLVGGGVRDLLLGRKPKDFDISTNARPEQIRALFRNCILIGRRFRLAHIRYGDKIIETSTFRRTPETVADPSDPEADLFQRDDNLFGTPQEDALRRDFTVNGLFYDIETFSIIDYVGGIEDLEARRIRCIGDPCIRFREDPVRMIRAVRFASRLDFTLDPDTLDAIIRHGDEMAKAAPARLLEEITRLFAFSSGERAVRLLQHTGLLRVILPEVADCLEDERCDSERFWRRLRALDEGDTVLLDATPALIFSVLLLDALKFKLERDWPADEFPRLKFDKVHAFLEPLSQRLRFPRKLVDRIVHIYLAQNRFLSTGGKRGSIANFVTQDSFHESLALAEILDNAEGKPQTRLHQWRDMLAERMYGRDENGHGERRRVEENRPEKKDEESEPGMKLSRSARRRRNKRMQRQREREDGGKARESAPAGEKAVAAAPTTLEEAVPAAEAVSENDGKPAGKKSSRSRNRRAKSARRKNGDNGGARPVEEAAPAVESAEPAKPLTAAAFYAVPEPEPVAEPEAEPSPKKRGGRKSKAAADKAGKKSAKDAAGQKEPEKPKPLPMDRADEADIPMHWLDEI